MTDIYEGGVQMKETRLQKECEGSSENEALIK